MWTLFAPKTKVIAKPFMKMPQVFEVELFEIPSEKTLPRKQYVLAWCWDWTGKEMTKVYFWLGIEKFSGTKDINQLACYPLKYHKTDQEGLKKTLEERGIKYDKIVRSKTGAKQMYAYNGEALSERRNAIRLSDEDTVRNPSHFKSITYENFAEGK